MFRGSQGTHFPLSQKLLFGGVRKSVEDIDDDDEDVQQKGYSDDDLALILRRFSAQHIDRVSRENLPSRATVFGRVEKGAHGDAAKVRDADNFDQEYLDHCGFDIMVQVLYLSYFDLKARMQEARGEASFERDTATSSPRILAPETLYLDQDDIGDQLTCKFVPETLAFADEPVEDTEKLASEKLRASRNFVSSFIEPDVKEIQVLKVEQEEEDKELQLREKYGSLKCISSEQVKSEGVLGNGSCPVGVRKGGKMEEDQAASLSESPSLLSRAKREAPAAVLLEQQDSDDDFHDFVSKGPSSDVTTTTKRSFSPPKKKIKVANRFGISVEPITMSQRERAKNMKQKKLHSYFNANGSSIKAKRKDGTDLEKALELSKQSMKDVEHKRKLREPPPGDLDDSFDRLPEKAPLFDDLGYKYAHSTVRSKADRKKLLGFDCPDCEKFYANEDLSEVKRQDLIQRCSRHRAKFAPSGAASPKEPWKVTIDDHEELDKTQIGPPIRSRRAKRNIKL